VNYSEIYIFSLSVDFQLFCTITKENKEKKAVDVFAKNYEMKNDEITKKK
jgi:galactokinase